MALLFSFCRCCVRLRVLDDLLPVRHHQVSNANANRSGRRRAPVGVENVPCGSVRQGRLAQLVLGPWRHPRGESVASQRCVLADLRDRSEGTRQEEACGSGRACLAVMDTGPPSCRAVISPSAVRRTDLSTAFLGECREELEALPSNAVYLPTYEIVVRALDRRKRAEADALALS